MCPAIEDQVESIRQEIDSLINVSVIPALTGYGACGCGDSGWRRAAYLNVWSNTDLPTSLGAHLLLQEGPVLDPMMLARITVHAIQPCSLLKAFMLMISCGMDKVVVQLTHAVHSTIHHGFVNSYRSQLMLVWKSGYAHMVKHLLKTLQYSWLRFTSSDFSKCTEDHECFFFTLLIIRYLHIYLYKNNIIIQKGSIMLLSLLCILGMHMCKILLE